MTSFASLLECTDWLYQLLPVNYVRSLQSNCSNFRYLVETKWFKQWKKFVGYDSWDTGNTGEQSARPGPIDNSSLFRGKF